MIFRYGIMRVWLFFFLSFLCINLLGQNDYGRIKCVCIDPGHGGKDPGSVGLKSYEKNIVLGIARKVGKLIKEQYPDIKIVYTRDKDVFIELNKRGKIANDHKADLFISIHANSVKDKSARGIETYVLGLHKTQANLQVAMKENEVIKYEDDYTVKYAGFDPSRAESYIIFSMMQNLYLGKSLEIAGLVQEELIRNTHKTDRSVRQAGYLVLKDVAMPAILIETGFISNPEEERFLNSTDGQNKIAGSIVKAFSIYKKNVEKNTVVLVEHSAPVNNSVEAEEMKTAVQAKGLFYAVQVASASGRIENHNELCRSEQVCELQIEGRYRYYVGKTGNYENALQNLEKIRKEIRDCFVIAVYNGKLVNVGEAKQLEKKPK